MRRLIPTLSAAAALLCLSGPAQSTEVMVPLYAWPSHWAAGIDDCAATNDPTTCERGQQNWSQWEAVAESCRAGLADITAVINPASGPGVLMRGDVCDAATGDRDWQAGLELLQDAGCTVLGYVATDYGRRDANQMFSEVIAYANSCQMTGRIDGIFFDEYKGHDVTQHDVAFTNAWVNFLGSYFGFRVVLNPGTPPEWAPDEAPAGELDANPYASVVYHAMITVENTPEGYAAVDLPQWQLDDVDARSGLLLHGVDPADREGLLAAMDQAWRDQFGVVYLTDDTGANPWDTLSAHWDDVVGKAASLGAYGDWSGDALQRYCDADDGPRSFYPGQCGGAPLLPGYCIVLDPYSPNYYLDDPTGIMFCDRR